MASAGQRDRFVTIQQLTDTDAVGESGFPVEPWRNLTSVWMQKSDMSPSERFQASQIAASFDSAWEMEYLSDMDPESVDVQKERRLVYSGRTFDIVGAEQIGRRAGIRLMTVAGSRVE